MNEVNTLLGLVLGILAISKLPWPGQWQPPPQEPPPPKKRKALPPRRR
jgi:hypothetical protein